MEHVELSQYADREVAQIEAHRKIYAAKNPPPEKPKLATGDTWFMLVGLNILYVAAVIVSAPHTIPLFLKSVTDAKVFGVDVRYVVGGAAFTLIELALIILTFIRIRMRSRTRDGWEEGLEGVNRWLKWSLVLVFTVALCANVYSTLNSSEATSGASEQAQPALADYRTVSTEVSIVDTVDTEGWLAKTARRAIFLMIGASAPMLALFVGDMSSILWLQRSAKHKEDLSAYDAKLAAWTEACNAAYRPAKLRGVSGNSSAASSSNRPLDTSGQDTGRTTGQGYTKRTDARTIVRTHLTANPQDANANVRELAALLGVGKSTVSEVQQEFRTLS